MIEEQQERVIHLPLTKWLHFISNIYILVIGGLLPLYHVDGFTMIGDRKYRLFFIATLVLVPAMLILYGIRCIGGKSHVADNMEVSEGRRRKGYPTWSILDSFVLAYGVAIILSYFCSPYKEVALWGYQDWHMGTVTQLSFVGIYFALSRCWKMNGIIIWYFLIISGVIFTLGILNRFAVDPLGMYEGLEYWNKTHLLATMGNINWYCGYVCVSFPMGLWLFQERQTHRVAEHIPLILYMILGFGTLVTQGSTSGLVMLLLLLLVLLGESLGSVEKICRFLQLNLLLGSTTYLLGKLYLLCDNTQLYFPADLRIEQLLLHPAIKYYIMIILFTYGGIAYCKRKNHQKILIQGGKYRKHYYITIAIILLILAAITGWQMMPEWGSGRGLLWGVTWRAYCEMPLLHQLFGVGADCYAPYMGAHYANVLSGFLAEWWGDAVVACAHNEWLNVLITTGAVGAVAYIGIFVSGIIGFLRSHTDRMLLGCFGACIFAYCCNNTFSFQQVLSTPLLFMLMGMGESIRKELIKSPQ